MLMLMLMLVARRLRARSSATQDTTALLLWSVDDCRECCITRKAHQRYQRHADTTVLSMASRFNGVSNCLARHIRITVRARCCLVLGGRFDRHAFRRIAATECAVDISMRTYFWYADETPAVPTLFDRVRGSAI